jgi:hypothetical protein
MALGGTPPDTKLDAEHTLGSSLSSKVLRERTPEASALVTSFAKGPPERQRGSQHYPQRTAPDRIRVNALNSARTGSPIKICLISLD